MNKKLLFAGIAALSCVCSINAGEVLTHVLEYDGTKLNSRIDYTYDANGMLVEKFITKPSTSDPNVMENSEKVNYGYDTQNRCNMVENYVWNRSSMTFIGRPIEGARTTTTYDDETGRVAEQLFYKWGTNKWETDYSTRCVYTYDGNTSTENRYKKLNGKEQADPYEINEYTYDDNMNVLQKIRNSYTFNFSSYEYVKTPTDKEIYEYDDKGNVTLKETYMYSSGGYDPWGDEETSEEGSWSLMNKYKYEYEYDDKGNITKKTTYVWRDYLGEYATESVLTYEYFYGSNDALELPYSNSFDEESSFDGFTTSGTGEAGAGWKYENGTLVCTAAQEGDPNIPEILYLPAMRFSTDNEVEVTFKAKVADATKAGKLQMILCSNNDAHTPLGTIGQIWDITGTDYQEIKGLIVPEKSDAYVIGICFDNYQKSSVVSIDDIEVKNGRPTASPSVPYNFEATPARDGSLQVKLIWYTPNTSIGGDFITHVDKMELYRDDMEEPLYTTQATGATLAAQFIDNTVPEKGEYTYRVYAYLDGMKSDAAIVTVKVGYSVPAPIEGFSVVENDDHSVTLSWNSAKPEDGDVKYHIMRNGSEVLDDDFAGNTFTDNTIETSDGQKYVYYFVQPYNETGFGDLTTSGLLFVGEANPVPFKESFAGGVTTHQWMNEKVKGYDAAWGTGASSPSYPSVEAQDGDGGFAAFLSKTLAEGDEVRFTSEKINLSTLVNPTLKFYMYQTEGEQTADAIVVEASKDNGTYETVSGPIYVSGHETAGWTEYSISLDKFKGEKNVRLSLKGISGITHDILIDNITIGEDVPDCIGNVLPEGVKVYAANGEIVVKAPSVSNITVFTVNGTQIYAGQGSDVTIPAAKGIYVVNIYGKATKVTVF